MNGALLSAALRFSSFRRGGAFGLLLTAVTVDQSLFPTANLRVDSVAEWVCFAGVISMAGWLIRAESAVLFEIVRCWMNEAEDGRTVGFPMANGGSAFVAGRDELTLGTSANRSVRLEPESITDVGLAMLFPATSLAESVLVPLVAVALDGFEASAAPSGVVSTAMPRDLN